MMCAAAYSVHLSFVYDDQLKNVDHYRKYPQMLPWIGKNYPDCTNRLLVFGESHYLPPDATYHHDTAAWYDGIEGLCEKDIGWTKTRGTVGNGIITRWKNKSKVIYRNIEKALYESEMVNRELSTAFREIAYMNFFQRPAEVSKKSIKVCSKDKEVANDTSLQVVELIQPNMIVFTSSLAFKHAKNLREKLNAKGIAYTRCPHPGTRWWNSVSRKYKNKTGKNHFIDFVKRNGT